MRASFNNVVQFIDYTAVPFIILSDPQFATVGLTEQQMMEQYEQCDCRVVQMKFISKSYIKMD